MGLRLCSELKCLQYSVSERTDLTRTWGHVLSLSFVRLSLVQDHASLSEVESVVRCEDDGRVFGVDVFEEADEALVY